MWSLSKKYVVKATYKADGIEGQIVQYENDGKDKLAVTLPNGSVQVMALKNWREVTAASKAIETILSSHESGRARLEKLKTAADVVKAAQSFGFASEPELRKALSAKGFAKDVQDDVLKIALAVKS